ncbi:hypothetical protein ACFFWC_20135 [Plantactinospora siamensis]|uniref:DUF998 domain-containing protein n=1 Tax=Plantactinospora siamensis TaxID=555372 RepID=A0ABV6P2T0_9ACTN
MRVPTMDTVPRPRDLADRDDPAVLYAKSYLLIRTSVGLIGILLPVVLIVGEAYFLRGGVHVRGSLSAYYFTPMRDIFVASLSVTGFLLVTYLAGQPRTWDFWLSLLAGIAVIGVVFFPTSRPELTAGAARCGTVPEPAGCSPIQQSLGETPTATVHFCCAAVFMLSIAVLAFLFAYREQNRNASPGMARVQKLCGWLIIAAVAWVGLGRLLHADVWELTPLYLGEVVSVAAFGVSWLLTGRDLLRGLLPGRRAAPPAAADRIQPEPAH